MTTPLLATAALAAAAPACIASVHDGDTVRLCSGERLRLAAIDAPELPGSPSCRREKRATHWCDDPARAAAARDALAAFLATGPVLVRRLGHDRYGRTLARLTVNGHDAGKFLLSRGLARPW